MTRRDAFEMFLLSAFWGVSFLLIRLSGEVFPPVWVALLRSVFGAAVLLIVGGDDSDVLELNRRAMVRMACHVRLEVVPGATHLFPEPGAMEEVAAMAREWFLRFLRDPRENGP